MLDNAVSRAVGFAVRIIVIITALLLLVVIAITGIVVLIVWPLLPPLAIVMIGRGLFP